MNSTKNKVDLINKNYKGNKEEHLMKQYEMFVDSSENVSSKRMTSNNFYLVVNTALFAIAGYLSVLSKPLVVIILSFIGIFLCLSWSLNLSSYKRLNTAKFRVIHDLEEHLPARVFSKEDEYLNGYYTFTKLERYIPYLFIVLYAILIIIFLPSLIAGLINYIILIGGI